MYQRSVWQIEDYNQYTTRIYGGTWKKSVCSPSRWCAPPLDVLKLNTNTSVGEEGWIDPGVVARDSTGQVASLVMRRASAY